MNKLLLFFLFWSSLSQASTGFNKETIGLMSNYNKNAKSYQILCLATQSILDNSYVKVNLASDEIVFNQYLSNIDYNKELLTQQQIKSISFAKAKFYQNLGSSGLFLSLLVKDLLNTNIKNLKTFIPEYIKDAKNIIYDKEVETNPKNKNFPADTEELISRWKEKLSLNLIYHAHQLMKADIKLKKEDALAKAQKIVNDKMQNKLDKLFNENFDFYFQSLMDGVLGAQDPHSLLMIGQESNNFMKAFQSESENFGISFFENTLGEIEIAEVVAESPAEKTTKIKEGDILIGVEHNKKIYQTVNFNSLKDLNKLLGEYTSKDLVYFHLLKKDNKIVKVEIRKAQTINSRANYTSGVIQSKQKIGYLKLESFYNDFYENKGSSSYDDVKKTLIAFKEKGVNHLIFDLRGNGGGFLLDGIKIAGLFIKNGPIVQVKSERDKEPRVDFDPDDQIIWDRRLTVLIDHRTASASEIVAAALQDYGRALIVGGNSFGKGSVQQVIDLNKLNSMILSQSTLDAKLKITVQRFYRISGESIQWTGVIPDVEVFSPVYNDGYEKDLTNSLTSDKITTSSYNKWAEKIPLSLLKSNSEKRTKADKFVSNLQAQVTDFKDQNKNSKVVLNFDFLKKQEDKGKEVEKLIESIPSTSIKMEFIKHENNQKYDLYFTKNNEKARKSLEKDLQFQETLNIINDWEVNAQ